EEADRHRGIEVGTRHVADRVDHGQHDQAEGQGDADMGYGAAAHVVDDDGAGAGEDDSEGAQALGGQFAKAVGHAVMIWRATPAYLARLMVACGSAFCSFFSPASVTPLLSPITSSRRLVSPFRCTRPASVIPGPPPELPR